jgi:hypothetical protein
MMQRYEYQVIPAPSRGEKLRGVKTTADRFAQTLAGIMNTQARNGWEYLRTDTLPSEERVGFTKRQTVYLNLLVFRRPAKAEEAAPAQLVLGAAQGISEAPRILPAQIGMAPKLGAATADLAAPRLKKGTAPE